MKSFLSLVPFVFLIALAGCRAHVVTITLINTSTQPIKTIIVDYPNATFGKDALAPGATFSYTIKPLETGPLKIQFADARGATHAYVGPALHQNEEGSIDVRLDQNGAVAKANVAGRR
jgi:hypothetical protein